MCFSINHSITILFYHCVQALLSNIYFYIIKQDFKTNLPLKFDNFQFHKSFFATHDLIMNFLLNN